MAATTAKPSVHEAEVVCVTICIDYADYLAETLPHNRPLFSTYYIITEERDTRTRELAAAHGCVVLYTTKTHAKGAKFNKSGMLFDAQQHIHRAHTYAWVVILDADMYLPVDIWASIRVNALNKNGIYGLIRHVYASYDDYVSGHVACVDNGGAVEVAGYFQLYWLKTKYYPKWSNNCGECDLRFMHGFSHKTTFPVVCVHFGEKGANWNGRVSAHWTACAAKSEI
jgi:hypothetical protein